MAAEFLELYQPDGEATQAELRAGLLAEEAHIEPKFFYDALGSRLFEAITELPEYYPTRTEAQILRENEAAIAETLGEGRVLVDLGAGNCAKAAKLLRPLRPSQYVAVDVSADFVKTALGSLATEHPHIPMLGVGLDFSKALLLPPAVRAARRLLFYPGSSIGNFTPQDAQRFLQQARTAAGEGGALLMGVDLHKSKTVLEPAYDDALGVTAAFNKNLLLNVNRWLGTNFDPKLWRHLAIFDEARSRIEMHLESIQAQQVLWQSGQRTFKKGERIHTENSYKYQLPVLRSMLHQAGFSKITCLTDARQAFSMWLAEV